MLEYLQYCLSSVVYQAIAKNVALILTIPDFFDSLNPCCILQQGFFLYVSYAARWQPRQC